MCKVASAAKDTLRDFRLESDFSRSSRSRAAACCSSSVRKATFEPEVLFSLDEFDSDSSPVAMAGLEEMSSDSFFLWGGISGRRGVVGLRMDRGITLAGAARVDRLFPVACFNPGKPPGPILLLLDFFFCAVCELPTLMVAMVAFSLSIVLVRMAM